MTRNSIRLSAFLAALALTAAMLLTLAPGIRAEEEAGPKVNLDVCALDNESETFAVGQIHTWILRGGIPENLASARSYVLTHELDSRLSLEPGVLVNFHTADGRQVTLEPGNHYRLEQGRGIGEKADRLRLDLTPAGMAHVSENAGEGKYAPELRLSFRASINRKADMGTAIPGRAHLAYTDAGGVCRESDSDQPEVHTGGIHIAVTDEDGVSLSGARFRLARPAREGESLSIDGKTVTVSYVSFFTTADLQGESVTEATTGSDGRALAYGLPFGRYYLVETGAPARCEKLEAPIPVTVNQVSHLTRADGWMDTENRVVDNTITLVNPRFRWFFYGKSRTPAP